MLKYKIFYIQSFSVYIATSYQKHINLPERYSVYASTRILFEEKSEKAFCISAVEKLIITCIDGFDVVNLRDFRRVEYINVKITGFGTKLENLNVPSTGHRISEFNITNTDIETLHSGFFKYEKNIKLLNLSFNKIMFLESKMFEFFENLQYLLLFNNPLQQIDGEPVMAQNYYLSKTLRIIDIRETSLKNSFGVPQIQYENINRKIIWSNSIT